MPRTPRSPAYTRSPERSHPYHPKPEPQSEPAVHYWNDAAVSKEALRTLRCPLCDVISDDDLAMGRHLGGKRHLAAVSRWREDECQRRAEEAAATGATNTVNVVDLSEEKFLPSIEERQQEWNTRYSTDSKVPQFELATYLQNAPPVPETARHNPNNYDNMQLARNKDFYCALCDVYCQSRSTMEVHMSGKEHRRKSKRERVYACDMCQVVVSSEETLQAHKRGVPHIRRAAEREKQREQKLGYGLTGHRVADDYSKASKDELIKMIKDRDVKILEHEDAAHKMANKNRALQTQVQKLMQERNEAILNGERDPVLAKPVIKRENELRHERQQY